MTYNKPLIEGDKGRSFEFAKRALMEDANYGLDLDRLIYDRQHDKFHIMEYAYVEKKSIDKGITPWNSHPARYWHLSRFKFMSLNIFVKKLNAQFYIINYTFEPEYEDQVRVLVVSEITREGIICRQDHKYNFNEFSDWFRIINASGGYWKNTNKDSTQVTNLDLGPKCCEDDPR